MAFLRSLSAAIKLVAKSPPFASVVVVVAAAGMLLSRLTSVGVLRRAWMPPAARMDSSKALRESPGSGDWLALTEEGGGGGAGMDAA